MNLHHRLVLASLTLSFAGCTSPVFFSAGHSPDALPGATAGTPTDDDWANGNSNWPSHDSWGASLGNSVDPRAPKDAWSEDVSVQFSADPGGGSVRAVEPGSTGAGMYGMRDPYTGQESPSATSLERFAPDRGATLADTPGSMAMLDGPARSLDPDAGGRPYLLELFQEAREERDALREENASLVDELDRLHEQLELLSTQPAPDQITAEAEQQINTLTLEAEQAKSDMLEFAARLAHAEIARLEADRRLLQYRIAEGRKQSLGDGSELGDQSAGQ